MSDTFKPQALSSAAVECLGQLFVKGPTWDGDLVSKAGRSELAAAGLAHKWNGWNTLTLEGVQVAVEWDGATLRNWHDKRWYRKKNNLPEASA